MGQLLPMLKQQISKGAKKIIPKDMVGLTLIFR